MKTILPNKIKSSPSIFLLFLLVGISLTSVWTNHNNFGTNHEWESDQSTFGTVKSASETAYLSLAGSFDTDGLALGLDVQDLVVGSNVWIADGDNGIVKLTVNKENGLIYYNDGFYNGGTAYDVVYKNQWGRPMLVVADGEDGLEILDPEFDDLYPGFYSILSYGGGAIENNTRSVAVYDEQLYDPGIYDPLTFIYTQDAGSGSEVESVYVFWDITALLAGEFRQRDSYVTDWANFVSRVYVSGKYLYTAGWNGVSIFDITNPVYVTDFVASCPDTQLSNDVYVQGNYLYVADNHELVIIDITTPSTPVNLSSFDEFDGPVTKIFVDGNYAYLADSQGINIVDISNPASPEKIGYRAVPEIYDIYVEDGFVYLAAGLEGFLFLELEVVEDSLSITSPSLEQTGKNCPLSWTSQGDIPYVKISLYSGGVFSRIIALNTTNDGSFNWGIPGDIPSGTSYSIRIEDASNPTVIATSNTFEIYTNSLSFSSSYEGITWEADKEYCILWESTGYISSVDIQLLKEGGVIHDIVIGTENDGEYDCFIPADLEPSSEYQLKISDHADPSISLTSETFTIKQINEFWNEMWFWGIILAGVVMVSAVSIILGLKHGSKGLRVFVSHAMEDNPKYGIEKIAKYLKSQKRISKVHICEADMWGNINEWMDTYVPRSQLLIIFFTENSKESAACKREIKLAFKHGLVIMPILGEGMDWDNLAEKSKELEVNITNEFGTKFDFTDTEKFKEELYAYAMRVKKKIKEDIGEEKRESKAKKLK